MHGVNLSSSSMSVDRNNTAVNSYSMTVDYEDALILSLRECTAAVRFIAVSGIPISKSTFRIKYNDIIIVVERERE